MKQRLQGLIWPREEHAAELEPEAPPEDYEEDPEEEEDPDEST